MNTNNSRYKEKSSLLDKRKKELKKKITPSERKIKDQLKNIGVRAIFQKGFIVGHFCIVDFYIPQFRICLEIDGGYHNTPEQRSRDCRRDSYLTYERKLGVIHITNELANIIDDQTLFSLVRNRANTIKSYYYDIPDLENLM